MNVSPVGKVIQRSDNESVLEIRPAYQEALEGIQPGDRLQVLYWMHRLSPTDRQRLRVHPQGERARPLQGVFSVRSPMRPNPIGVTVVEVRRVEGCELTVSGLDAFAGSPIVDIKSGPKSG